MKFLLEFGKKPNRGNCDAAGIDFFVPDASLWDNEAFDYFKSYLTEKGYNNLVIDNNDIDYYNKIILYVSHYCDATLKLKSCEDQKEAFETWCKSNLDVDGNLIIRPLQSVFVPSGIRIKLNSDSVGVFLNKSGVGVNGLVVKAQVIDKDYTGYVHLNLANVSDMPYILKPGAKLVQLLEMPVCYDTPIKINKEDYLTVMANSQRGEGMCGSTGLA